MKTLKTRALPTPPVHLASKYVPIYFAVDDDMEDRLLRVLNDPKRGKLSRRVLAFVREIQAIRAKGEGLRLKFDPREWDALRGRMSAVNHIMERCRPTMTFGLHPHFGFSWIVLTPAVWGRKGLVEASYLLAALADHRGDSGKLSECVICGKWYIKKRRWHEHCSMKCRRKAYRSRPEVKAKHADYMKNYYRDMPVDTRVPKRGTKRKGGQG